MELIEINAKNIDRMLAQHDADGGNEINESLGKLFSSLSDEENKNEVSIKIAALNQLYSTAIQYIKPVAVKGVGDNCKLFSIVTDPFIALFHASIMLRFSE